MECTQRDYGQGSVQVAEGRPWRTAAVASISVEIHKRSNTSVPTVKGRTLARQLFITVSLFTIAAIALDRMYWVAFSLMVTHISPWRYPIILIIVWLTAIILAVPLFRFTAVDDDGEGRHLCAIIWTTDSKEECLELLRNYTYSSDYYEICPTENPNLSHCSFS